MEKIPIRDQRHKFVQIPHWGLDLTCSVYLYYVLNHATATNNVSIKYQNLPLPRSVSSLIITALETTFDSFKDKSSENFNSKKNNIV